VILRNSLHLLICFNFLRFLLQSFAVAPDW